MMEVKVTHQQAYRQWHMESFSLQLDSRDWPSGKYIQHQTHGAELQSLVTAQSSSFPSLQSSCPNKIQLHSAMVYPFH